MRLTQSQIEEVTKRFQERLVAAQDQLGGEAPSLGEIQKWMVKNQIESKELLSEVVKTVGPGKKAGEKNLH